MQSLENTPVKEIDKSSYTHYLSEHRETETIERHSELVKKLLKKLPESERTVVTLYYLGEMTTQEIGKFLGRVSEHDYKSATEGTSAFKKRRRTPNSRGA